MFINVWINFGIKLGLRGFKIGTLGVKSGVFPESYLSQLAMASDLVVGASCSLTAFPVSRSCIFFTRFCFELAFGVNMKVLDNCVRFPVPLV